MSTIEEISIDLSINVDEMSYSELRKLESVLYRTMGLLLRFSGSDEIDAGIIKIQRLIAVVRAAQIALHALQIARMSVGDPLAWASFIVSGAVAVATVGDVMYDNQRGT